MIHSINGANATATRAGPAEKMGGCKGAGCNASAAKALPGRLKPINSLPTACRAPNRGVGQIVRWHRLLGKGPYACQARLRQIKAETPELICTTVPAGKIKAPPAHQVDAMLGAVGPVPPPPQTPIGNSGQ